jgi:polyphosphate kinase 2
VKNKEYEEQLRNLQIALVRLQRDINADGRRMLIVFEGRDAAGKGGAIRRFTENLSPRSHRIVALPKPSDIETGQWYFERYVAHLPDRGEMVFFDRSWYNRAVVEPVMGFCTPEQYDQFMQQVPHFEKLLVDDGIELIKLWFSINKDEQEKRIEARRENPLKQWKIGPIDEQAQQRWDDFTKYARTMMEKTSTKHAPWTIIRTDDKEVARLESIRYVLGRAHVDPAPHHDADVVLPVEPGASVPHRV